MDSLEHLQIYLDQLGENKIFIGLIMIMVNIGARFIIDELGDEHLYIIKSVYFRRLVIFCSVFMATRDIGVSVIVTVMFAVVINEILGKEEAVIEEDKSTGEDSDKEDIGYKIDKQIELLNSIKGKLKQTV